MIQIDLERTNFTSGLVSRFFLLKLPRFARDGKHKLWNQFSSGFESIQQRSSRQGGISPVLGLNYKDWSRFLKLDGAMSQWLRITTLPDSISRMTNQRGRTNQ